jgi:hypothetical protein
MVKLKNGSSVDESSVQKVMVILRTLDEVMLFELFQLCRDPECPLLVGAEKVLQRTRLVDKKRTLSENLRNIVLSAVETKGLNIWLTDPVLSGQSI